MKSKPLPENPNLKNIREWRGYSQKQLAEKIGIPTSSLQYYERKEQTPSFDRAIAIARALNISLKTLAQSLGIPCHDIPDDIPSRYNPDEEN